MLLYIKIIYISYSKQIRGVAYSEFPNELERESKFCKVIYIKIDSQESVSIINMMVMIFHMYIYIYNYIKSEKFFGYKQKKMD